MTKHLNSEAVSEEMIEAGEAQLPLRSGGERGEIVKRIYLAMTAARPVDGLREGEDWFAGDVDCDGNELVTIRADELQRLRDEREKFMWQVRDTCKRAEIAEAKLAKTGGEA